MTSLGETDTATRPQLQELLRLQKLASHFRLASSRTRHSSSGQQKSRAYGRGMDYAESRTYQPGDDIRRLDWRLTARTGKLHTKLFQEDRQGTTLVLLDTNASLAFGTRACFKSVTAARAAALIGWMASHSGEKVGLACFGQHQQITRPRAGKRGALALCHALTQQVPEANGQAAFSLADRIRHLRQLRPSRVLLLSDGFSLTDADNNALSALRQHSQLSLLGIADAIEVAPPASGHYAVQVGGKGLSLSLFGRKRKQFSKQLNQGQQHLNALARQQRLPYQYITGEDDPLPAIRQLLGKGS